MVTAILNPGYADISPSEAYINMGRTKMMPVPLSSLDRVVEEIEISVDALEVSGEYEHPQPNIGSPANFYIDSIDIKIGNDYYPARMSLFTEWFQEKIKSDCIEWCERQGDSEPESLEYMLHAKKRKGE